MFGYLLEDTKITEVMPYTAAGTSTINSTVLDMGTGESAFDAVCFIVQTGDATSGTVLTATAKRNTASSTSSPTPVTTGVSATYTATSSTDTDNKLLIVDVRRCGVARYIYLELLRATQNCEIASCVAIQYRARKLPATQGSTVIASSKGLEA